MIVPIMIIAINIITYIKCCLNGALIVYVNAFFQIRDKDDASGKVKSENFERKFRQKSSKIKNINQIVFSVRGICK